MTQRQRKAVGTVLTILSLVVWSWLGMWLYERFLLEASNLVHLVFFVGMGLAWIVPAMPIIRWMAKPDT